MKRASTISRILLATGALTLCLMGGVNLVYAESTSPATLLAAPEPTPTEPTPTAPEPDSGDRGYDSGA